MAKKGAMELSMNTFVTIILVVTVMVLGFVLINSIFSSGKGAIDEIDKALQDEINKLFAEEGKTFVVYPASRQITLKRDDDPKGFAFSVENDETETRKFTYTVEADPGFNFNKCGSSFTAEEANSWLIVGSGSFTLGKSASLELAELVLFEVPKTSPKCTISYNLEIKKEGEYYEGTTVYVTIK